MTLDNLVYCKGNHDVWFLDHIDNNMDFEMRQLWEKQGGRATIASFCGHPTKDVYDFIENAKLYHTIDDKLFCHAGVPLNARKGMLDLIPRETYIWDRTMVEDARYAAMSSDPVVPDFSEVFVGHTPTLCYGFDTPKRYNNVWMCDTGASYDGKLTIMDANTKEFWQSDPVNELYPNHRGRY
jgi:serine/threonine protein phosphatase 1